MPTYEFRCPNGHEFERFYRKISDAASEVPCPECGAVAARQLSGGAGLLFKGSGFYLTDYRKNAHRSSGAPSGSEKKGGEGGSGESAAAGGTPGETKPAAKPEAKPDSSSSPAPAASKPPSKGESS